MSPRMRTSFLFGLGYALSIALYRLIDATIPSSAAAFLIFGFLCSISLLGISVARVKQWWPPLRLYEAASVLYQATLFPLVFAADAIIFKDYRPAPVLLHLVVGLMVWTIIYGVVMVLLSASFNAGETEQLHRELYGRTPEKRGHPSIERDAETRAQ